MKPEDMTISPYGRGDCPACGRDISLTKVGKIRHHGAKDPNVWPPRRCEGAGQRPKGAT